MVVKLLVAAILLVACQAPLTQGRITDLTFEPQHTETRYRSEMQYGCGLGLDPATGQYSFGCGRYVMVQVPYQVSVDDRWWVTIRDCQDTDCREETHQISRGEFNRLQLGTTWYVPAE